MEYSEGCTSRPGLNEFVDVFRPRLSELRDALGGWDCTSLEMQLEAEIE
jgi:hypothetical protein